MFEVVDVSRNTISTVRAPQGAEPKVGVILHTTDGTNSLEWLQGGSARSGRPASSDVLVRRDGTVLQLMPKGYYAFHAGVVVSSALAGGIRFDSKACYGIECENADSKGQLPTMQQHHAVAGLLLHYAHLHAWAPIRVAGHHAVAYPMGRRNDPRGWDWGYMFWVMAHRPRIAQLSGAVRALGVI